MRTQWSLIFGLVFALIVAIFAVFNVDSVQVNYIFGTAQIPLILVILGSALLGGLVVGLFGIIRQYRLQKTIKRLEKEAESQIMESQVAEETQPDDVSSMEPSPDTASESLAVQSETVETASSNERSEEETASEHEGKMPNK